MSMTTVLSAGWPVAATRCRLSISQLSSWVIGGSFIQPSSPTSSEMPMPTITMAVVSLHDRLPTKVCGFMETAQER